MSKRLLHRGFRATFPLAVLILLASLACRARPLDVGQAAPEFALPATSGGMVHLADFPGRTVVLAFFPKAFTGG